MGAGGEPEKLNKYRVYSIPTDPAYKNAVAYIDGKTLLVGRYATVVAALWPNAWAFVATALVAYVADVVASREELPVTERLGQAHAPHVIRNDIAPAGERELQFGPRKTDTAKSTGTAVQQQ